MNVADLFCGAGGFSEGFRQAGFQVTKALDIWTPAVVTHEHNHPDTEAIRGDILSYQPERLGPVDVLIGSPPCTEFSFANRGGSGDIEEGLRLVYRFLRFVYELQPRWWVMENVPRVLQFLPEEIPLRKLGINKRGSIGIPVRAVLNSADFGTPQLRKRAFSGDFPLPAPTHSQTGGRTTAPWRTLGDVLAGLPDPLKAPQKVITKRHDLVTKSLKDPVYGFELPLAQLTDHFSSDILLTEEEVRENRKAKEDHSWYGRMAFPDELDRPGRTVMATNLRVARETTIIGAGSGRYRRLSVREASSVQGFPITYQWWGATSSLKYKLVGNAVAPPVAFAVARAILGAAELPMPERPYVIERVTDPAPPVRPERERKRAFPITRRFREHVPGSKVPGFRVDLDNQGERPGRHLVEWRAVLYRGGGKKLEQRAVTLPAAIRLLRASTPGAAARRFVKGIERELGAIPDASTLQRIRAGQEQGDVTPYVVLEMISGLVSRHFDAHVVGPAETARVDRRQMRVGRRRSDVISRASVPGSPGAARSNRHLPARVSATLVATAYACAVANGREHELGV